MTHEYTFGFVKPHAYKHRRAIRRMIENAGLTIEAEKDPYVFKELRAQLHYEEHRDKTFFGEIIDSVTEGSCALWIVGGDDAIYKLSELTGATNPEDANEGTIRRRFGRKVPYNAFHRSDSPRAVKREVYLHFTEEEVPKNIWKVIYSY